MGWFGKKAKPEARREPSMPSIDQLAAIERANRKPF